MHTKTAGLFLCALCMCAQSKPPVTRPDNVPQTFHGVTIVDPYPWLENGSSVETRAWIGRQNAYAHSLLDRQPVRATIAERLTQMMRHDHLGGPELRGRYYFFVKRTAGQDLWSIYRRKAVGGPDELLIDPAPLSMDQRTSVSLEGVSEDGNLLAYSVRQGGEDETEIHIFDVRKHADLGKPLPKALYLGLSWKTDGSGFYYAVGKREAGKRVYFHGLASDSKDDRQIFGEGFGPDTWIAPVTSENGHYLLLVVQHGWAKGELYFQELAKGGSSKPLITGIHARFDPQFAGDSLMVQTDWKAPKGRILRIDLRDPAPNKWREVVPAGDDAIESFTVIGGKLFVNRLHNVTSRLSIYSLDGAPLGEVALPGPGSGGMYGRADQDEGLLWFSSYTAPYSLYRYSASTGARTLWYQDAVPFDSEGFATEQVWYPSKDGTRIPMFLIHRKGLQPNGQTPTILYGYGGFNVSITPSFNPGAAWWIEHGGIYAVANIRGGGEFGEEWHRAGMLDKKQNVFDDFIAAAEWLIGKRYTNPRKLAIWGGSNGGLLVGAALTQRPDLFQAVVCWHPDLDMVRYYTYTKNNNPPALLEYGNAGDPQQFKYLYAYSPYEHVQPGTKYPAVLFESGDADTRVPPEQARKMTARLQAATSSGRPILLLYDTKAGHSGGTPLSKIIEDSTFELTFVAWQLGIR
ncbi:MAG TPA: prolyl oligopeptidase family serine peptidase [Bryobacteraceae bacterium]|nr:prolyl oligopeptidase family serine peptidase [Bryobacteraceae bacterium]